MASASAWSSGYSANDGSGPGGRWATRALAHRATAPPATPAGLSAPAISRLASVTTCGVDL